MFLFLYGLYCSEAGIVDDVHVIGVDTLGHESATLKVFHLLHALYLGEYKVGIAAHTHVAPRLVIVVVLAEHQFKAFLGVAVIHLHSLCRIDVHGVHEAMLELNQPDYTIINKCDKFGAYTLSDERCARRFK